ncbi:MULTISPECIES: hypothetical protein [Oceanobacillus]|uniref:Uncharacterized protein n=1 Tax=Oceanobacillus kimchii TaxID=746691 RepID=A0ABQ5TR73_9BACI|nr:hypothetical protein [Oceanobacillus kimchii]GLO68248.1 hypothetical protein MACH08_40320 [Oceanobacillus kimchii]
MVDIQGYGKGYRVCTECNAKMEEGYCIDSGMYYFCSDEHLEKNFTREAFLDLYDDGDGDSYYTTWYDEVI